MSLSDKEKSKLLESVCGIHVEKSGKHGFGNGVFITPSHVLTAWHVISGVHKSNTAFENHLGEKARMKVGGTKLRDAKSDLCIVELDKPIGKDFYVRPVNKHMDLDNRSKGEKTIGAVFAKNVLGIKQVTSDVETLQLNLSNCDFTGDVFDGMSFYLSKDSELHLGHSGAPIMENNGFVASVFSGTLISGDDIPELRNSNRIYGASPQQVANFVDHFLFSPESVHQPEI